MVFSYCALLEPNYKLWIYRCGEPITVVYKAFLSVWQP